MHFNSPEMTDEARDTQRAQELYGATSRARGAAFARLRQAVSAGDIDAMRAAYAGNNGFLLGTGALHGVTEHLVLTEVMDNSNLSLELLGVFFNELGGRFIVDLQYNICVFSMLLQIESSKVILEEEEAERWTLRLTEVVRYLVEKLEMPIRMTQRYSMRPLTADGTLMELALHSDCWACYTAFSQYIPAPTSSLLERVLQQRHPFVRSNYWVKRLVAAVEDEDLLWRLLQQTDFLPQHIALLKERGVQFQERRENMQALLFLQRKDPGNAAARTVMEHENLPRMILTWGFEHARFYRELP